MALYCGLVDLMRMFQAAGGTVADVFLHVPRELDRMIAASCIDNARSAARASSDRRSLIQVLENEQSRRKSA